MLRAAILNSHYAPTGIPETDFSFAFCKKKNKILPSFGRVRFEWVDINPRIPIVEGKNEIPDYDYFCLLLDPETIISPPGLAKMVHLMDKQQLAAAAPTYNQSRQPAQTAKLDTPYFNYSTFREVADLQHSSTEPDIPAHAFPFCELEPSFLCLNRRLFETLARNRGCSDIFADTNNTAVILKNVLFHRFGNSFASSRPDLVALIPDGVTSLLDVGCAKGYFGEAVRRERPEIALTGIEANPTMAGEARRHYDSVMVETLEAAAIADHFDHINCGDVLEHLAEPWSMLQKLSQNLNDHGTLVASVPNANHWSIVRDLSEGRFEYIPLGLMCISHLRWFTEQSLRSLFEEAGFTVTRMIRQTLPATPAGEEFIKRAMTLSSNIREYELRCNELVIVATWRG